MYRVSVEASPSQSRCRTALRDRRGAVALLGLALLLVLAGCGRARHANPTSEDSFTVALATEPAPPLVGDGELVVTLRDAAGQPMNDAQLAIEANMSHAGMTPVSGSGTRGEAGIYRVPIAWTMAGDWYVDVRFTLPDGQAITRRFPVQILAQ